MDLSKIPKSPGAAQPPVAHPSTPQPAPIEAAPIEAAPGDAFRATPSSASGSARRHEDAWLESPEAFFVGAIGLIVCWFASPFFAFLLSKTAGSPFTYTYSDVDGSAIPYTSSWYFVAHLASALAGLAMIFEGLALGIVRKKNAAWAVVALMALAAAANAAAFVFLLPRMGGQLLQLVCFLICGYAGWSLFTRLRG